MGELHPDARDAITGLGSAEAFGIFEFYENVAGSVKQRLWTITAWILTVCAALLGFQFGLYQDSRDDRGFDLLIAGVSLIGLGLCWFLLIFIKDQGWHLQGYWTRSNVVAALHPMGGLPLLDETAPPEEILEPGYKVGYPGFCSRLETLVRMFALAFIASAVALIALAA